MLTSGDAVKQAKEAELKHACSILVHHPAGGDHHWSHCILLTHQNMELAHYGDDIARIAQLRAARTSAVNCCPTGADDISRDFLGRNEMPDGAIRA